MTGAITRSTDSITCAPHQTAYLLVITASLIIIFVLDSLTPLGMSVWALYIFPLILSSHFATHRAPFVTAAVCSILTVVGYLTSPIVMDRQMTFPLFNRGIILGFYWIVAVLVVRQQVVTDQLVRVATLEAENKAHLLRQDALRKSTDEIYDLYNNAPCGYLSLDSEGRFVAINQTALDWLGYMRDEIIGKKQFVELLTPAGARTFHDNFPRLLRDGDIHDLEFDSVRKDGSTLPVLLNGTAIKDADGRLVASRMTMIDMTDHKRAEDVLRQAHDSLEAQVRERTAQLAIANEQLARKLEESKRIEEALRASETRFWVMADHAPVLIWIADTTKACIWFNKPWLTFVGRSMEQELGNGWSDNVHPEDFDHCLKTYEQAFDARQEFTMEYRLKRWDGEWCWVLDNGVPRYETDGAFAGYIGSCIDITALKRSEEAARESDERLSGIIGSAMDAIITIDEQQLVTNFNGSAERMFCCSAGEALGQSINRFIPERFRTVHSAHITDFGKTAVTKRQMGELGTIYGLRANGEEFPIEASISHLNAQGRKFYTVILRDVSQRKQAEEALRSSEREMRAIVDTALDAVIRMDDHGVIMGWNPQAEQTFGWSASEAIGQNLAETIIPLQYRQAHAQGLQHYLKTGEGPVLNRRIEITALRKSGEEFSVELTTIPLRVYGETIFSAFVRDITERKKAEISLLRKNKDLETLLHVTSHDLKEPLRSIESFSHLVQERYADRLDDKGRDYLRRVVRAAQRLDRLLTDILDLSRAQRMEAPLEEVDAEVIIGDVLKRLESRSKETGARITVASPLPRLRVNRTWATQGLYNLVANALKFTQPGQAPDIEIASYFKQDTITGEQSIGLTVKDRGPGVQPDQRDRIFQLFQRAVGREIEGTGAGLAIVRRVAERHDGQAWVQPREGGGSEFIITFGHGILMPHRG